MSVRNIAKGAASIALTNVFRVVVQTISVPLVARVISPDEYGLVAMAMPTVLFLMMLADSGIGTSLVRTETARQIEWHTCFWLSAALGIFGGAIVALIAPIASYLLAEPRLTPIIQVLAVVVPLQTLSLIPGAALLQQSRFGVIASTEIVALTASIGITVSLALSGFGVWSLVWQQITLYMVRSVLTLLRSPYRPRCAFELHQVREHVIFGRNLLATSFVSFASRSLENFIIGRVGGAGLVGVYAMALQFARLPFMLVTGPLHYVLYPYAAAIRDDVELRRSLCLLLTRLLATVCLPGMGLAAFASMPLFHLFLSEKWLAAAPIFMRLAPAIAIQSVTAILGAFLMADGRTDVQLRLAVQNSVIWLIGLSCSVWYGLESVAITYSLCSIGFTCWALRVNLSVIVCRVVPYGRCFCWPAVATIFALAIYRAAFFPDLTHDWSNMFLAAGLFFCSVAVALAAQWNTLKRNPAFTGRAT